MIYKQIRSVQSELLVIILKVMNMRRKRPLREYRIEEIEEAEGSKEYVERGRDVLKEHEENIREIDQQIEIIMKRNSAEKRRQESRKKQAGKENQVQPVINYGKELVDQRASIGRNTVSMGKISRNRNSRAQIPSIIQDQLPTVRPSTKPVVAVKGDDYFAFKLNQQLEKPINTPILKKSTMNEQSQLFDTFAAKKVTIQPASPKPTNKQNNSIMELSPISPQRVQIMEDNRMLEQHKTQQYKQIYQVKEKQDRINREIDRLNQKIKRVENSKKKLNISMSASPPPISKLSAAPITTAFADLKEKSPTRMQRKIGGIKKTRKKDHKEKIQVKTIEVKVGTLKKQSVPQIQQYDSPKLESLPSVERTILDQIQSSTTNISISCQIQEEELLVPQEQASDNANQTEEKFIPAPTTPSFNKQTSTPTPHSELIPLLERQLILDQQLRNLKIWYTFHTDTQKNSILQSEIESADLHNLNQSHFQSTMEQHNPFYQNQEIQLAEGIKKLVATWTGAEQAWDQIESHCGKRGMIGELRNTMGQVSWDSLLRYMQKGREVESRMLRKRDVWLMWLRLQRVSTTQ